MATTLRAALAEVLPTADSADNNNMSDVIGNKTDTSSGDSLVSLNNQILELIGPVTAVPFEDSIFGNLNALYNHIHSPGLCYPTLADGKTVNGGAGAWQLGTITELIPAGTISVWFDIHFIMVEAASANDVYELVLYANDVTEIGRVRTVKQSTPSGANNVPVQIPPQAPDTKISLALASKTGGDNVTVSVFYHTYA